MKYRLIHLALLLCQCFIGAYFLWCIKSDVGYFIVNVAMLAFTVFTAIVGIVSINRA